MGKTIMKPGPGIAPMIGEIRISVNPIIESRNRDPEVYFHRFFASLSSITIHLFFRDQTRKPAVTSIARTIDYRSQRCTSRERP